jgi:hypothetical protein
LLTAASGQRSDDRQQTSTHITRLSAGQGKPLRPGEPHMSLLMRTQRQRLNGAGSKAQGEVRDFLSLT